MNAVNEPRFADLHAPLPADRVAAVIERLSRILPAHALRQLIQLVPCIRQRDLLFAAPLQQALQPSLCRLVIQ